MEFRRTGGTFEDPGVLGLTQGRRRLFSVERDVVKGGLSAGSIKTDLSNLQYTEFFPFSLYQKSSHRVNAPTDE